MRSFLMILILISKFLSAGAQHIDAHVREGNTLYKQGKFDSALSQYQQSLAEANDPVTNYNFANALFKTTRFEESEKTYDKLVADNKDNTLNQKAFYNKGVSLSRQNKLEESIAAYKKAVLLDPTDQDARINLQKALDELKKKQPPEQQKKQQEKKKQDKKDRQNPPPQSSLTKKQVEQLLKALQQREQQVQQKMQNRSRSAGKQEKDW